MYTDTTTDPIQMGCTSWCTPEFVSYMGSTENLRWRVHIVYIPTIPGQLSAFHSDVLMYRATKIPQPPR